MNIRKRDLSRNMRRVPGRSRRGLFLEQLADRLALASDAPFVAAMVPNNDGQVLVRMSEEVVGVDIADFVLLRSNQAVDLALASIHSNSPSNYTVQLPKLIEGLFELRLVASGSKIADLDGQLLRQDASTQLNIRIQPPSWHVEYNQTPLTPAVQRIAALGDSMTYEGGGSYVSVLRNLLSSTTASIETFASAGWKADKLLSVWQNDVRVKSFDTIIVFSGVPDLSSVGTTAESVFQQLETIYSDATSRGLNVVCIGVAPWAHYKKWTAERQVETVRLNALIRQYALAHPNTMRYVDAYAGLGMPDEPQSLSPRYDVGDGLHLVPVGDERLARLVSSAVLSYETPQPVAQSAIIAFDRNVYGLTTAHIQLRYSSNTLPVQLTPIDGSHFRIDFSVPSGTARELRLNLDLDQGLIVDDRNRPLGEQPDAILSVDYQMPLASLQSDLSSVSTIATEHIKVVFSEPVADLSVNNFKLLRDRIPFGTLQGIVTRRNASTFDLQIDPTLTTQSGTYQLVYEPTLGILDSAGNLARRGALLTWVKLDTAPLVINRVLKLPGTSGLDNLEVVVSPFSIDYTINGFEQSFSRNGIERIEISPGIGRDLVTLRMAAGTDPLPISALSTDNQDRAYLYDSAGNDIFTSIAMNSTITSGAFQLSAVGFATVTAFSTIGNDRARLIDSSATDSLVGTSWLTTMKGPGYEVSTMNFPLVEAISQNGGTDTADLYDSVSNDTAIATMNLVTLNVPGYQISAKDFSRINVRTTQGVDKVTLTGSAANERFVGQVSNSVWTSGSLSRYFYNFDQVDVSSGGGSDQATMYDSPGDDALVADSRTARLTTPSSQMTIRNFPRANIYARTGRDNATFNGSALSETFIGQATFSSLSTTGFATYAYGFDKVNATSGGGNDIAKLYGSTGNDYFEVRGPTARLVGSSFDNMVTNFKSVFAYSQGGNDTAYIVDSFSNDNFSGSGNSATITNSTLNTWLQGFTTVTLSDTRGGFNRIVVNAITYQLNVGAGWRR